MDIGEIILYFLVGFKNIYLNRCLFKNANKYGSHYDIIFCSLYLLQTGFFSGLPHLVRTIFAIFFSQLGDYLLSTEKMSRSGVRKFATIVCKYLKNFN